MLCHEYFKLQVFVIYACVVFRKVSTQGSHGVFASAAVLACPVVTARESGVKNKRSNSIIVYCSLCWSSVLQLLSSLEYFWNCCSVGLTERFGGGCDCELSNADARYPSCCVSSIQI